MSEKRIRQADINRTAELLKKWIACGCTEKETYVRSCLVEALLPCQTVETKYGELRFHCPSKAAEFRARTFHEKEPETLEWLDSLERGETLWDIGANVGLYSLYAAQKGVSVLAFEPSPANYHLLNRNIEENRFHDSVSAYCLAFSNKTIMDYLYTESSEPGSALITFGEAVDWQGKPYEPAMKQGMIAYSLDNFVERFAPPLPNHLKIDVDGIEPLILEGASNLLTTETLQSLQIELNYGDKGHAEPVIKRLSGFGFRVVSKRHAEMFENSEFSNLYNVLFKRVE